MQTATLKQIKSALEERSHTELVEICTRLGKSRLENKDLLTYLLFEASDEAGYIQSVKTLLDNYFNTMKVDQLYIAKKSLRKIIRTANRFIKFSDDQNTAIQLQIHVYSRMQQSGMDFSRSKVLENMRLGTLKKINKLISSMHEDLQYDYRKLLDSHQI